MDKHDFDMVVAVKLKTGEDILGAYCGTSDGDLMLYRPIRVKMLTHLNQHGNFSQIKFPELYDPFSDSMVFHFRECDIISANPADFTYSRSYWDVVGNLMDAEDESKAALNARFDKRDIMNAMETSDGFLIVPEQNTVQ